MKSMLVKIGAATACALAVPAVDAHFKLIEPASWIVEDECGDPQKIAPCGGTLADGGTRSGAVTEVRGGQALRVVDGLWPHHERRTGIWETDIEIPNIDCESSVLQIIQFMADHPGVREGGFSCDHCAILDVTADPELPVDGRW